MTGYHDYLIVLSPPESIVQRVKELKNFSYDMIGEYHSHYSKAHITIQLWQRKKPVWMDPIILSLERGLQTLPPVILDINGFAVFDHQGRRTIYAKFDPTPSTKVWFKYLRRYFQRFDFEPHITITRSIPSDASGKLWPHFKNLNWNEQFKVDKLTILRRDMIGHDKSYLVFKEIPFNHKLDFYAFTDSKLKAPLLHLKKVNPQQISLF